MENQFVIYTEEYPFKLTTEEHTLSKFMDKLNGGLIGGHNSTITVANNNKKKPTRIAFYEFFF